MGDFKDDFSKSIETGFLDRKVLSNIEYQPELLVNEKKPPKKVLSILLEELENCSEFYFSVAFVTTSGVAVIINTLKELESRRIRGKILVSQYLNFTQPEALKRLLQLKNIDLRISTTGANHTKGYIFKKNDHYNLIVGSSNLTAQALSINKEWNLKLSALDESGIVERVLSEFQNDFQRGQAVTNNYIEEYEKIYQSQLIFNRNRERFILDENTDDFKPNSMQIEALNNLKLLRDQGKTKALIISATGTGKTFLSAFDAKEFKPKKLLFVVHRLTIANDAMNTFQRVFGTQKSMGLYSGNIKELECDFIFSTIQTISKTDNLTNISKTHFDYIIVDESHRSGADSYLRLINYFQPKFLLGMTATPERTDGANIFKLFDYNIAYEIRLSRAMEEEMLSSFHYYGISDLTIDGKEVNRKSDFRYLISNERVERIIEFAKFYGSDNGITRGLIFCSETAEAIKLSELFNQKGLRTIALTGDSKEKERVSAIEKLESDNLSEKLDYIITVDIFNEGIDIPKINQIIMLRPTASAIVFVQQLGRGLRRIDSKSYLTVIDFIGNYENNYLIPIALYGDTSYNKDSLRKLITEGSRLIPGASTINFDIITKEKIFSSIDSANMQLFADLKKDYELLKFKIGRIPMMMDFIEHGSRDPFSFVSYTNSYYNFVTRVEKSKDILSEKEIKLLELFSKEINNSKRVEESIILEQLIQFNRLSIKEFREFILKKYGYNLTDESINSFLVNLNFEFIREKKDGKLLSAKEIYNLDIVSIKNNFFEFSNAFSSHLTKQQFKLYLLDSTKYSINEFDRLFQLDTWRNGFTLYRKYSRKDVFRILNFSENPVAQNVGGYLVSHNNEDCPIFVNYHKESHISESTKYEDRFLNRNEFLWMTKSNRTIQSNDVISILGKKGPIRLPLFVKKDNDEGMDFYFMGEVSPQLEKVKETTIKNDAGKNLPIVQIQFKLKDSVATNIYNYIHEKARVASASDSIKENSSATIEESSFNLRNPIPLFNFFAAAGSFSDMQSEKDLTLIEGPENSKNKNYFACKVIGESMNRIIPNGSICLFKIYTGGSKNGKVVLVENRNIQDPDFNSAFTIKTYSSEKIVTEDSWEHEVIMLRPNSYDASYSTIVINNDEAEGMRVIGEFVKVLE